MDLIMPDNFTFKIRPMISDDLNQAISLSDSEGWNQTENDWKFLLENSGNICIVAVSNDKVIGTATALNHSNKIAWIGMVLVDKSFRGQGIGKMLLTNIIGSLKHVDSIKLDATPAGLPLYQKLGFIDEYKICRMINPSLHGFKIQTFSYEPVNIDPESFSDVLKLDEMTFGTARTYLLQALLNNYPAKSFLVNRNKKLEGYVFGRNGARFNYIGPLVSLSEDSARILVLKALESLNNQPVALDVHENKEELSKWLETLGFVKQRQFVRMYLKSNSNCGLTKYQYLISGPEFG
jgi:ribosomal protein S18 acetylase RimI-like enzyme